MHKLHVQQFIIWTQGLWVEKILNDSPQHPHIGVAVEARGFKSKSRLWRGLKGRKCTPRVPPAICSAPGSQGDESWIGLEGHPQDVTSDSTVSTHPGDLWTHQLHTERWWWLASLSNSSFPHKSNWLKSSLFCRRGFRHCRVICPSICIKCCLTKENYFFHWTQEVQGWLQTRSACEYSFPLHALVIEEFYTWNFTICGIKDASFMLKPQTNKEKKVIIWLLWHIPFHEFL